MRPRVVSVVALDGRDESAVVALAATVAQGLDAPLAAAIIDSAHERAVDVEGGAHVQGRTRGGVLGSVGGHTVDLGNSTLFTDLGLSLESFGDWPDRLRERGEQVLFLAVDGRTAGFFGVDDARCDGSNLKEMEDTMQTSLSTAATTPETIELTDGNEFSLRIAPVTKQLGEHVVRMLAYNGSIPGPTLRVRQGSELLVNVVNDGDLEATVHWHGLRLDNRYDGTTATQNPIPVGGSFTYRLAFPDPGVYWYHPHIREDYGQEMGLYGNIVVVPSDEDYWSPVNRELTLTLDDLLIEQGKVAAFDRSRPTYTAMGRFGNTMLVNGEPEASLRAQKDEVIRFYFTNTANTRVFHLGMRGARMKLVGGDSGRYEREAFVETVVVAPSERLVVDVMFDQAGQATLEHRTPGRTYRLGTVTVLDGRAEPSFASEFEQLRINSDMTSERTSLARYLEAKPDKTLALVAEMDMGEPEVQAGASAAYVCPMHPEVTSAKADRCPKCGMKLIAAQLVAAASHDSDHHSHAAADHSNGHEDVAGHADYPSGIEWEDDMVEVNRMTNTTNMRWKLIDRQSGAEGAAIEWRFRVGDRVKVRLVNEMDSDHPMQHPFHIHGAGRFLILSRDGVVEPNLVWKDTVLVPTGQTVDILLDVTHPGIWMAHCHIAEHHESGMMLRFQVDL